MAWETRNGNRYYYRKVRVGQKVVSIYVGKGPKARQAALQDLLARLERERERKQQRQAHETDQALAQIEKQALQLLALALLAAGYRKVKGQWRKPRRPPDATSPSAPNGGVKASEDCFRSPP